jgi:two-component system OmpR family sensor kinase
VPGPDGDPSDEDPPPSEDDRPPGAIRAAWHRTPLLARLVGITAVLLAAGLALAGTITTTSLRGFLIDQVDRQLKVVGQDGAKEIVGIYQRTSSLDTLGASSWLNGYAIEAQVLGSEGSIDPSPQTVETYGRPHLPDITASTLDRYTGSGFTVTSTLSGSSWRVWVTAISSSTDGDAAGWVILAQPLAAVQSTVARAALLQWSAAAAILLIGVIVGAWAVRRSLRPLREIEAVAATIAAGDLSGRVPEAPTSTEVGRLGAALNGMLSQIETAFDARTASEERMRRFVADASHELRTPLAAIRGYGELYRMGALTETAQVDDTMRRIEQSATRMGGLVEDLLALARLDAGRQDRSEPVDLAVLATDAAHDLRALDPARTVRVGSLPGTTTALDEDPAEGDVHHVEQPTVVHGDEARLRQVLANLIGNVVRHTPAASPVEILVGRRAEQVVVEVRDHGPGISPEHARRVFERFYRVDPSRTRDGAGLGMAIVAAIVEAHGGTVELVATEGGGATVRVALPTGGPAPVEPGPDHPAA